LDEFANKPVVENRDAKTSETKPKNVRKNNDALIIDEWVSDDEDEEVAQPKSEHKIVKPSIPKIEFVKPKQPKKKARKTVKKIEKPRQNTHRPRGNQKNWNNMMSQRLESNFVMYNKACYVRGSFDHLQANCNYHQQQIKNQKMIKPVWNYNQMVNYNFFAKNTQPHAKRNMVPRAVLLKSSIVNTATQNFLKTAVIVNTTRQGNPQMDLQDKRVIDSGCSRHMTGNMSHLTGYEEIDGGYVAFGGKPQRRKNHWQRNYKNCQVFLRVPGKKNMYGVDLKNIVPKGGLLDSLQKTHLMNLNFGIEGQDT
nr:retrotransposon Orf1 [Tanacetum cinerariifolium]